MGKPAVEKLKPIRQRIDKLDERIIKLLNERAGLGVEIAKVKAGSGASVLQPARESQILERMGKLNTGPLADDSIRNIFREIFSATRAVEKPIKVSCLGPEGSFSHLACLRFFGSSAQSVLQNGIEMVFADVERQSVDYGVVPIENNIEGAVGRTFDLFINSPVKIFAETYFDIHLNLLSLAGRPDDVKTLYSHYMPLGQCKQWLSVNMPRVKIVETSSTAQAAVNAEKDPESAAIGAREAARIYGLNTLAEGIEDRGNNQTRFLVISRRDAPKAGADKTSILFSINDESGALHKILRPFAAKKINLSRIQSRPSPVKEWEYVFFVDFDGYQSNPDVEWALSKIKPLTAFFKILGSYPSCKPNETTAISDNHAEGTKPAGIPGKL